MGDTATEPNQTHQAALWVDWQSFPSFSGAPSDNVFFFTRAVHRFAFTQKRQRDDAWMADYAYGCLSDEALYWFEGLDRHIQRDWSELKPAIIAKFPWNTSTPATSRARVKIVRENGALLGYVGPLTRDMNNKKMATKPEEALVLDIVRTWDTKQTAARIRVAVPNESYPFIGLEQQSTYWDFRACNAGPEGKGSALADSGYMELIAFSKIWTIKKLEDSTEELHAEWVDDNDTRISLQTFTDSAMSRIWMRPARLSNDISMALMLERF